MKEGIIIYKRKNLRPTKEYERKKKKNFLGGGGGERGVTSEEVQIKTPDYLFWRTPADRRVGEKEE